MANLKYKNYCFTAFQADPPTFDVGSMHYLVYQRELCPRTGRPHWQGYVQFKKQKRIRTAQNELGLMQDSHFEKQKGSNAQARDYCKKPESRAQPPEQGEFGEFQEGAQEPGARNDVAQFAAALLDPKRTAVDVLTEFPREAVKFSGAFCKLQAFKKHGGMRDVHNYVFYGPPGTGKTQLCYRIDPDLYRVIYGNSGTWFDGYNGEKTVLFDEFDGKQMKLQKLLMYLDKYPLKVEYKGGSTWACWTTVLITANHDSRTWYDPLEEGQLRCDALSRRISPPMGNEALVDSYETADALYESWLANNPPSSPAAN